VNKKTASLSILIAVWALGTAAGFWLFEGRYLRPVLRPAGAATARLSSPPAWSVLQTDHGRIVLGGPGPTTVLNFWNPDCPCSRFMEPQVALLAAKYEPRGVRFVTIIASGLSLAEQRQSLTRWRARGVLPNDPALADAGNQIAQAVGVWAAPAAVILDAHGKVAYVGAYNAARYCSATQSDWAAQALEAIVQGRRPARASTPFYGCQLLASKPQ
jgi:thiol-disulfide isomerase/thioredoxin